ncbi:MAG: hypothetical protein WCL34_15930 [Methylococcaceae bacterium]
MAMISGTNNPYSRENINGTSGNDTIDGLGGLDNIDGGAGIDTVLFFDSKNNFTFTTLAGITRVKGLSSADSKYEYNEVVLTNVENVQFTDSVVNIGTTQPIVEEQPEPIYTPPVAIQHPPTGTIAISGNAIQDETLSIQNTLNDADGLSASTPLFRYQWLQNGKAISGATQST